MVGFSAIGKVRKSRGFSVFFLYINPHPLLISSHRFNSSRFELKFDFDFSLSRQFGAR